MLYTGHNVSQDHDSDSFTQLSEGIDLGWSDSEDNSTTDDNLWGSSDEDDDTLVWDQDSQTTIYHITPSVHHPTTTPTISVTDNSDRIVSTSCSSEMLRGQISIPTNEIPAYDELTNETFASQIMTLNTSSEYDIGSDEDANMDSLVTVASVPPALPFSATQSDSSPQYYKALDDCSHDVTLLSRDAEQDDNSCFDELGDFPSSPSLTAANETMSLSLFEGTTPFGHTANPHNILGDVEQCNVEYHLEVGDCVDEAEDFVEEDFDWD